MSSLDHRRTFAIISHPDAGKTTLTEKLLLYGGAIHQAGSVKARRASRKYLGRVLERPPRFGELFRHYYSFATVALDRMFLLRNRFAQFDVRVHGRNILEEASARGHLLEQGYDSYGAESCLLRTEALEPAEMARLQRYAGACMLLQPSNVDFLFRPRSFFGIRSKLRVAREILAHRLAQRGTRR